MSAWPEAVWIVKETQKALNVDERVRELDQRLALVENRILIISDSTPTLSNISNNSLWFRIIRDE